MRTYAKAIVLQKHHPKTGFAGALKLEKI